jgi:hypothetical protein
MDKQKLNIEELWKTLKEEEIASNNGDRKIFHTKDKFGAWKGWFSFKEDVNLLKGLNRQLWLSLFYSLVITAGYIVLFFGNYLFFVKAVLVLLVVFNVLITSRMLGIMKLVRTFNVGNNILNNARTLVKALNQWKKFQLQFALWVYPWAILGGGVMGYQIGSGLTDIPIKVILILLLFVVPLSWISHRLALWLFNRSFQKSIARIENWITDVEN